MWREITGSSILCFSWLEVRMIKKLITNLNWILTIVLPPHTRLDPKVHEKCRKDAVKFCNENGVWYERTTNVEQGPLVLACLFHHINPTNIEDDDNQPKQKVFFFSKKTI